jgi:hypothetical protein
MNNTYANVMFPEKKNGVLDENDAESKISKAKMRKAIVYVLSDKNVEELETKSEPSDGKCCGKNCCVLQ